MGSHWNRRRHPEDVPTPVAVAVSDFCRRAQSPATAGEVREALALVAEADDFRVRALTDADPPASPLGPYALVDVLGGVAPALAAQRQSCGYYDLARDLVQAREEKAAPAPTPEPGKAPPAPRFALPGPDVPAPAPRQTQKQKEASLAARIAPRKRVVAEPEDVEPESEPEHVFLRRDLPRPRGRFSRVDAPKTPLVELMRPAGHDLLASALEKHEHRFALLRTLGEHYNGQRGGDLAISELEHALEHHGLLAGYAYREKQLVLAAYHDHRGASGRVAWSLGLSPQELQLLVGSLDLKSAVEDVRERFRRDALAAASLTFRLDLLGREKYLVDLGIKKRFIETLRREVDKLASAEAAEVSALPSLAERVGRRHAAPADALMRAFERLELAEPLRKKLAQVPSHS